jgi:hypothetical protein
MFGDAASRRLGGSFPLTATYQNAGLRFLYPENWLLSEADGTDGETSVQVTLESPEGGIWILSASDATADGAKLIGEAKHAIDEQFEDVEWTNYEQPFYGHPATGLDGFFYSLDLLVCAKIRRFQTLDRTLLIVIQSESRALDRESDVFDAITLSLLQSLTHQGVSERGRGRGVD